MNSPTQQDLRIIIPDMSDGLILEKKIIVETGANAIPVAISNLVNGTYFIKLISPEGRQSVASKFIKQ